MVRYITENEDETLYDPLAKAYLVLLVDGRESQSFPLKGTVHLGRDKSNSVVVADQKVSRHHAMLTPISDSFVLSDQGSANGTYLNGVLISQPTRLKPHDKIGLGDTQFMFVTEASPQVLQNVSQESKATPVTPSPSLPIPSDSGKIVLARFNNSSIWTILGCMGLIIVTLLLALAVLVGLLMGRGQLASLLIIIPGQLYI